MFIAIDVDKFREPAQEYEVEGIPEFNFIFEGKSFKKVKGADEPKFR